MHRIVREDRQLVPPPQRTRAQLKRHLEHVGEGGRSRWVREGVEVHDRIVEFPEPDKEAFHPERWAEDRDDLAWRCLVRGEEGDDCSVWEETEVTMVGDFVDNVYPGVV